MAIKPMKKIRVVTLQSAKKAVVEYLQKQGVFELVPEKGEKGDVFADLHQLQKHVAELDCVIKNLLPYYEDDRGFKYAFLGQKEIFSEKRVEEIAKQFNWQGLVAEFSGIEARLNVIHSRKSAIAKELDTIRVFESFGLHLGDVFAQKSVSVLFVRVVKTHFGLLKEALQQLTNELDVFVLNETETEMVFNVVALKSWIPQIHTLLKKYEATEAMFAKDIESIAGYVQSLDVEYEGLSKEETSLTAKIKDFAQELPKLKACYDYFVWKRDSEDVLTQSLHTRYTVMLTGWIEAEKIKSVRLDLVQLAQGNATLFEVEPEEGEHPPVDIENNAIFKPFEVITRMYGMPKAHELDPTPYLSVFFLVFFGLCLTDALYGLLLAVLCFGALVFMKVPRDMQGMLKLIGWSGVVTIFCGAAFGGFAGIPMPLMPEFIQNMQLLDTNQSDDIMKAVGLVFALGFFQLWFATVVTGMHAWKSGNKLEAIEKHFSWTIFFGLIGFSQFGTEDPIIAKYSMYAAFVIIALGLAHGKKWFLRPLLGPLMFINEMIAFGSNVLSYARLFALGLATGVIATVFNQIAVLMGGMMHPVIGIPLMILIILFGHVLNIGLNVLGAFIHSARLQFVEFFGKLIEGGGRAFRPVARKSTYVYLEN